LADGQKVLWDEGDTIGIFSDKQGVGTFTYSNGAFYGERIDGNEFHAFFPYSEDAVDAENPNLIHTRLHYMEKYKEGTFSRLLPMVAVSENNELQFKHTCGILHFSIKGSLYLKYVYLFANDESELLCGNGVIDLSEDTPILKMVADDEELRYRVDYRVQDYLNPEDPIDIYFIVPVGVYKQGIKLQLIVEDPETGKELIFNKVTDKAVEVRRAFIKSYSVVDYDEMLHEEMDSRLKERQALMDLYNATDGANWVRNDNWGSDKPLNEWYGVYMYNNHVWELYLTQNGLKGELPTSIGDLKELSYLILDYNKLTGELPETIGGLTKLESISLPNNQLTGTIPDTFVNLIQLNLLWLNGNHMDGTLSEALLNSDWWDNLVNKRLLQSEGYALKYGWLYESTDFSEDGEVTQLQAHTVGDGISIVITGEAYSDRLMDEFEEKARQAMEEFFDIEPYTTFRSYFDVYMVKAVSKNEVLGKDVAFSSYIDNGERYNSNGDQIIGYVHKVPGLEGDYMNVQTIVIIHGRGQSVCELNSYDYNQSNNIALCWDGERYLVQHEAGGHGMGLLADEYATSDPTTRFEDFSDLDKKHNLGWFLNVDYHSDPNAVWWSDFIANSDYEVEGIGVYEGGMAIYSKGIYRPTEHSIMSEHYLNHRFNAPSRWIIYQRIKKLAGLEYTFEDFLEYDKKNLAEIALEAQTRNYVEVEQTPYQQLLHQQPLHDCIRIAN